MSDAHLLQRSPNKASVKNRYLFDFQFLCACRSQASPQLKAKASWCLAGTFFERLASVSRIQATLVALAPLKFTNKSFISDCDW